MGNLAKDYVDVEWGHNEAINLLWSCTPQATVRWQLDFPKELANGAKLFDVTHLPCRSLATLIAAEVDEERSESSGQVQHQKIPNHCLQSLHVFATPTGAFWYFIIFYHYPQSTHHIFILTDPYRSFEILTDHCPPGVLHGQAVPATRAPRALQPQPQPVTSQWRLVPRCPRCPTARRCPAAAQRGALLCLGASWVISGNGCWTCWTYSLTIIDYYDRHFRFCGFHVRSWSSYITRLCLFLLIWFCLGYRWI